MPPSDGILLRLVVKALEREDMVTDYRREFENPNSALIRKKGSYLLRPTGISGGSDFWCGGLSEFGGRDG